jgi:ABC-type lipoprotein release transport system permease subunit
MQINLLSRKRAKSLRVDLGKYVLFIQGVKIKMDEEQKEVVKDMKEKQNQKSQGKNWREFGGRVCWGAGVCLNLLSFYYVLVSVLIAFHTYSI